MAATPAFLAAFRAFETPAARREALRALADELSPYEWRQVQVLVDARSFQYDIIGKLPTELVFHVFSYLDIAAPFRLQRVSRRWCELLRSPDLFKPRFKQWHDGTATFQNASYEDCIREAGNIHRFQTGKFLEVAAIKPPYTPLDDRTNQKSDYVALVDDYLIDVPPLSRDLRVTSLRTGEGWRASTASRANIAGITASDQMVAFWTAGLREFYVFNFAGTQEAKLQLPPYMGYITTCRGRTLVCGGVSEKHIELYLWDLDLKAGKTLRLDHLLTDFDEFRRCLDINVVPNPQSKTLTLFVTRTCETIWCGHHGQDMTIHYYHITFDGQLVQKREFVIPLPEGASNFAGASITSIRPVDRKGDFCVNLFCRYNHNGYASYLHFDEKQQQFSQLDVATSTSEDAKTVWWKDTFYQVVQTTRRDDMRIRLEVMNSSDPADSETEIFADEASLDELIGGTYKQLLLNDRYVVMLALDRIYAFSFVEKAKTLSSPESSLAEKQGKLVLSALP